MAIIKTWEVTSSNPRASHEAMDGESRPFSEPFSNNQMYPGDPVGGAAENANCSCVMTIEGESDVPTEAGPIETIDDAQAHVEQAYGYADLTGISDEDAELMRDVVGEVDRLAGEYPQLTRDPDWHFAGIGTYESAVVPRAVTELGQEAWAVTRNGLEIDGRPGNGPFIWLNPAGFREGTGLMGEIGFTAERTAVDAIIHEMGHAVAATSDVQKLERVFTASRAGVYSALKRAERAFMSDTGSIYAGGAWEEAFATVFFRLNSSHGLDGLTIAAKNRLKKLADAVNEQMEFEVL